VRTVGLTVKRLGCVISTYAVLTISWLAPATASAATVPAAATAAGCHERFLLGTGDPAQVRARVPARYQLQTGLTGRPLVIVKAIRCARAVFGGLARTENEVSIAAVIQSPDGSGCLSPLPVIGALKGDLLPLCDFYALSTFTDNPDAVGYFRGGGVETFPAHLVPSIGYVEGPFDLLALGAHLRVRAPEVAIDGTYRTIPSDLPIQVGIWWDGAHGPVRYTFAVRLTEVGVFDGTATATPDTETSSILGAPTLTPLIGPEAFGLAASYDEVINRAAAG
jgi:hypothetical protein